MDEMTTQEREKLQRLENYLAETVRQYGLLGEFQIIVDLKQQSNAQLLQALLEVRLMDQRERVWEELLTPDPVVVEG